jgi:hypothetical protein
MLRHIIILFIVVSTVSCASRSKLNEYGKELGEIRDEVRSIRYLADEMKEELIGLKVSVNKANKDIVKQTEDILVQKDHQDKMNDVLSKLKDTVVRLEAEKIPAKKDQLETFRVESDQISDAGFVVIGADRDGVPEISSEKNHVADLPEKKTSSSESYELEEGKTGFGYAVKDGVILWAFPTKDSDVLEILVGWQQLVLLGKVRKENIDWWKVKTNDYQGFVNSKFVIISD